MQCLLAYRTRYILPRKVNFKVCHNSFVFLECSKMQEYHTYNNRIILTQISFLTYIKIECVFFIVLDLWLVERPEMNELRHSLRLSRLPTHILTGHKTSCLFQGNLGSTKISVWNSSTWLRYNSTARFIIPCPYLV